MTDLSQFIQDTTATEVGGEFNWRVHVPMGMDDQHSGDFDVQADSEYEAKENCYLHIQGLKGALSEW